MANTTNYNLPYPDDYTAIADVPLAVKNLAEATDTVLEDKVDTSDLTNYYTKTEMDTTLGNKENTSNKVTSISSSSTDTQYPSAKCVYDIVGDIETALQTLNTGGGVE